MKLLSRSCTERPTALVSNNFWKMATYRLGRLDKQMEAGTPVAVEGYGEGKVVSYKATWVGANLYTIHFAGRDGVEEGEAGRRGTTGAARDPSTAGPSGSELQLASAAWQAASAA